MYCKKCGALLPDDAAFCGKCGAATAPVAEEPAVADVSAAAEPAGAAAPAGAEAPPAAEQPAPAAPPVLADQMPPAASVNSAPPAGKTKGIVMPLWLWRWRLSALRPLPCWVVAQRRSL